MTLTAQALQAVGATASRAVEVLEPLKAACALYGIDTPQRLAAFLAQTGHESEGFRYSTELWGPTPAQERYEGRADLGNAQPGDGPLFRGHGFIQTTGRANHAKVRDRLRERLSIDVPDFEQEPGKLAEVQWACLSAADFWDMKALNALADAGDFIGITRKVNGGLNGQPDRATRWEKAKAALGIGTPALRVKELPLVQLGPEPPADSSQESDMPPFLLAALPALMDLVPKLAPMFSSGSEVADRNIKAAQIVVEAAKSAIGAKNEQEMVDAIQNDPQAAQAVKAAIEQVWFKVDEVGGGIQAARAANIEAAQPGHGFWLQPSFWITLLLMPLVYGVAYRVLTSDTFSSEVQSMVVAAIISGVLGAVTGFWLGSAFSQTKKPDPVK